MASRAPAPRGPRPSCSSTARPASTSRGCACSSNPDMSYILDALRRADAERGRGGVPSIHTQQQFTPLEADDDRERAPAQRIGWIAGALALGLIGAVAWIFLKP